MRIGVNAGSLEKHLLEKYGEPCPEAMVESGLDHIRILEDNDFHEFKISVKASDVFLAAAAYQALAEATDAPIHLGITEAGGLITGTVKSAIGLGNLLWMGIGDTIRVSLSADPVEEVKVGFEILKSLGLRHRGVNIIACPSCARQGFDVITTVEALEKRLEHIRTPMSLSIIGCVVNGPGEALMTDVGFTGGGAGAGMVYLAGKQDHKLDNASMIDHIVELVERRAAEIEATEAAARPRVAGAPDPRRWTDLSPPGPMRRSTASLFGFHTGRIPIEQAGPRPTGRGKQKLPANRPVRLITLPVRGQARRDTEKWLAAAAVPRDSAGSDRCKPAQA